MSGTTGRRRTTRGLVAVLVLTAAALPATAATRHHRPHRPRPPEKVQVPAKVRAIAGDGSVLVRWARTRGALAYDVYRNTGRSRWVRVRRVRGRLDYRALGLRNNVTYQYRLRAVGRKRRMSRPSRSVRATPRDMTPPITPPAPTAVAGDRVISVSWQASPSPDVDHYVLTRTLTNGLQPATVTLGALSYIDRNLPNGITFAYRVSAVDHAGNVSAPSAPALATALDSTPPDAPRSLSATASDGRVDLSWTGSVAPDLDHYAVYRQNPDGSWPASPLATTTSTALGDTSVQDGTTYAYRVTALDRRGNESTPSASAQATPVDTTPPDVPAGLAATLRAGGVDLSWTPSAAPDVDHYDVYRQNADGTWPATPLQSVGTAGAHDTPPFDGSTYTYRVVAVDRVGNASAPTAPASVTPPDQTPPAVPAPTKLYAGDGQVSIAWPQSTASDFAHYTVYRQDAGGTWTPIAQPANDSWYTDTGLADGQSYTYAVTATDASGNESARSAPASATPGPVTAADPGRLFAASSPWNTPLPASAPVDPNSDLMMKGIDPATGQPDPNAQGGLLASIQQNGSWIAWISYTTPIYVVPADQPLVPVHVINPAAANHVTLEQALSAGVPIPPYAQSSAGSDGHMTIYQPSTDTLWDLWRACSPDGPNNPDPANISPQSCPSTPAPTWTVQYGGVIQQASASPGYYSDASYPGLSNYTWGSTATSLPVAAGTTTIAELRAGHIDHALALNIPAFTAPGAVCAFRGPFGPNGMGATPLAFPAQRSDGTYAGSDCIPEGARLRLDPNLDLSTLGLSKFAMMFAVAAQKYGMIVRDRDRGGVTFATEDGVSLQRQGVTISPYTGRPWASKDTPTPDSLFAGVPAWAQFKNFPWDHVQVMQMSVCHQGGPCPPGGN